MHSFVVTAALGVALVATSGSSASPPDGHARTDTRLVPAVEAAFPRESYRPGQRARLVVRDRSRTLTVQVLEVGPEIDTTESDTELNGVPVSPVKTIHRRPGRQPLSVPIGHWQSGLYFVRLEAPDGRLASRPSSSDRGGSEQRVLRSSSPR